MRAGFLIVIFCFLGLFFHLKPDSFLVSHKIYSIENYLSISRFYDSKLGRFLQTDTIIPEPTSQRKDRYAYSYNSPIKHTDPSGHIPFAQTPHQQDGVVGQQQSQLTPVQQINEASSDFWKVAEKTFWDAVDMGADLVDSVIESFIPPKLVQENATDETYGPEPFATSINWPNALSFFVGTMGPRGPGGDKAKGFGKKHFGPKKKVDPQSPRGHVDPELARQLAKRRQMIAKQVTRLTNRLKKFTVDGSTGNFKISRPKVPQAIAASDKFWRSLGKGYSVSYSNQFTFGISEASGRKIATRSVYFNWVDLNSSRALSVEVTERFSGDSYKKLRQALAQEKRIQRQQRRREREGN